MYIYVDSICDHNLSVCMSVFFLNIFFSRNKLVSWIILDRKINVGVVLGLANFLVYKGGSLQIKINLSFHTKQFGHGIQSEFGYR